MKRKVQFPPTPAKKTRTQTQSSVKTMVRSEAKKVLLGLSETKSYIRNEWQLTPNNGLVGVYNLCFGLAQGDDAENYLGKKIWIKDISVRASGIVVKTNTSQKKIRVVVFKSKVQITNAAIANGVPQDICFRQGSPVAGDPTNYHVDLNKVDLLFDKLYYPPVSTEGGVHTRTYSDINFKVKLNQEFFFDNNNSGIFKDKQIYMAVMGFDGDVSAGGPILFDLYYTVNFKDM